MVAPAPEGAPWRPTVAAAWVRRCALEAQAQSRFERLAQQLEGLSPDLAERAVGAAQDEALHATLCADLARQYGAPRPDAAKQLAPPIAPRALGASQALAYEMVATCCVAETQSMTLLTELLPQAATPQMKRALREIARDEVGHSQLGWAFLAFAKADLAFLGPLLPSMLAGSVDADFFSGAGAPDDERGLGHGLLPPRRRRALFLSTARELILPGLSQVGVDVGPAAAWVENPTVR